MGVGERQKKKKAENHTYFRAISFIFPVQQQRHLRRFANDEKIENTRKNRQAQLWLAVNRSSGGEKQKQIFDDMMIINFYIVSFCKIIPRFVEKNPL